MFISSLFIKIYESHVISVICRKLRSKSIDYIEGDIEGLSFWYVQQDKTGERRCHCWSLDLGLDDIVEYCDISMEKVRRYEISLLNRCHLSLTPNAIQCISRGIPEINGDSDIEDTPDSIFYLPSDPDKDYEIHDSISDFMADRMGFYLLPTKEEKTIKPTFRTKLATAIGAHISTVH